MTVSLSCTCTRRAGSACWCPKSRVTLSCAPPELEGPAPMPHPPSSSASAASAAATAPAATPGALLRSTHLHLQPVGAHRTRRARLELVRAGRGEGQADVTLRAGLA